jgi:hypothetical protein
VRRTCTIRRGAAVSPKLLRPYKNPVLIAGLLLLAAALACGGGGVTRPTSAPTADLFATATALEATTAALAQSQTQQAQAPPTAIQLPTAPFTPEPTQPAGQATPAPASSVFTDFAADTGAFETFDGAQVANGEFLLGPFPDCGDLQADTPYGCFAVCLACGVVSNYDMAVDVRYGSGISERTYGLVLSFDDVNGNSVVDRDDYYLEYQISAFVAFYTDNLYLREHVAGAPVGANGFNFVRRWDARPITHDTYGVNNLRAVASSNGTAFDLYLNGTFVDTIAYSGVSASQGLVGLSISGRGVQAAFDNFNFTSN